MEFTLLNKKDFESLKTLFPGVDQAWIEYKKIRLRQLYNEEIDIFIIKENKKIIGEITANYKSNILKEETIPNIRIYFEAFRIKKEYRGKGFGTSLLNYAIDYLKKKKYSEFTIGVEDNNEIAKHIYFKFGFVEPIAKGHGDKFDPCNYTLYLKTTKIDVIINKLLKKCNLGNLICSPVRISGGLLNKMYKVKTTTGTYAIKHLNPEVMKRDTALNNHIFAEKVANIAKQNNVSCLPAKIFNNTCLQKVDNSYFFVFEWYDGKVITENEISLEKCKIVAKELAKIHNINFSELKNHCKAYYDLTPVNWNFYIEKLKSIELKKLLNFNIERFYYLDKRSINSLNLISNNTVISHRDLDLPNILWKENNPMIIDWESSGIVNPVMELVDTAWNWSGGQNYFDKDLFKIFIKTYIENNREIKDFENAINANFKAKFGWLEYNLKRACGIECLDKEEQLLGEKEVLRSIEEINKFDYYSQFMKSKI